MTSREREQQAAASGSITISTVLLGHFVSDVPAVLDDGVCVADSQFDLAASFTSRDQGHAESV